MNLLKPPLPSQEELAPARHAEHALLQRGWTWVAWIAMLHCVAIAAGSKNRQPQAAKQLGACFQELFQPADWAKVAGIGIGVPLLWYFAIVYLSSLSARDEAVTFSQGLAPGGQFGGLILAMIILPVEVASRQLGKRGAFLGLRPRMSWPGLMAAGAAFLAVPVYSLVSLPGMAGLVAKYMAHGLCVIAGGWISLGLVLGFMADPRQALRRATLGHLLWPVWVGAMLVLSLVSLAFQAEERYWVAKDELNRRSPEFPATRYEQKAADQLRAEVPGLPGAEGKGR